MDSEGVECSSEAGDGDEWGAGSDVVSAESVKVVEETGAQKLDLDGRAGFERDEAVRKHDSEGRVKNCDSVWGDVTDTGKEKGWAGDTTEAAEAAASVEGDGAVAEIGIVNKGECDVLGFGLVEGQQPRKTETRRTGVGCVGGEGLGGEGVPVVGGERRMSAVVAADRGKVPMG